MRGSLRNGLGAIFDGTQKTLHVVLIESTPIWHQLLLGEFYGLSIRTSLSDQLAAYKEELSKFSDREIIYFISKRPRVRLYKPIKYCLFGHKIIVPIEVGQEKKRLKFKVPCFFLDSSGRHHRFEISSDSSMINLKFGEDIITHSIYEFLEQCEIDLGTHSEVTYVGRTNDPSRRVIDGNHRGLSDTLALGAEVGDDVFIHLNVFHARHHSEVPGSGMSFIASNSLLDYVDMSSEADLIEKLFINYFGPSTQIKELKKDRSALQNMLLKMRDEKNISSIVVSFELNQPCDSFRLSSRLVEPRDGHVFSCSLDSNNELILESLARDPFDSAATAGL